MFTKDDLIVNSPPLAPVTEFLCLYQDGANSHSQDRRFHFLLNNLIIVHSVTRKCHCVIYSRYSQHYC